MSLSPFFWVSSGKKVLSLFLSPRTNYPNAAVEKEKRGEQAPSPKCSQVDTAKKGEEEEGKSFLGSPTFKVAKKERREGGEYKVASPPPPSVQCVCVPSSSSLFCGLS